MCKYFNLTLTPNSCFQDIISIVIIFNSLYKNFDITIANLLKIDNKIIIKIQSIIQSKKIKNLSKQVIGSVGNLVIIFQRKKKKINPYDKCYNYYKLDYFGLDYSFFNKKLNRISNLYRKNRIKSDL